MPPALTPPQRLALIRADGLGPALGPAAFLARPGLRFGARPPDRGAPSRPGLTRRPPVAPRGRTAAPPTSSRSRRCTARTSELRDRAGRSDAGLACSGRRAGAARGARFLVGRPVLIYGFDDLTEASWSSSGSWPRQRRSPWPSTMPTAAPWPPARGFWPDCGTSSAPRSCRAGLRPELHPAGVSLRHVDRELFEPEPGRCPRRRGAPARVRGRARRGGGGRARDRAAARLRRRPDGGRDRAAPPVGRRPAVRHGAARAGVPVALDAQLALATTAVGRSLLALCRAASPAGEPADLLAHLRSDTAFRARRGGLARASRRPGRGRERCRPSRALGRSRPSTLHASSMPPGPPSACSPWRSVPDGSRRPCTLRAPRSRVSGRTVRRSTRSSSGRGSRPRSSSRSSRWWPSCPACGARPRRRRGGARIGRRARVARLGRGARPDRQSLPGPRRDRVRHLFLDAMQEGSFPGRGVLGSVAGRGEPLATRHPGAAAPRAGQEERYLFHVCASRPVERLYLSWRSSDEEGHPAARSPFVDEVLDLIAEDPGDRGDLHTTRSLAHVVPTPAEASTPLARARGDRARGHRLRPAT